MTFAVHSPSRPLFPPPALPQLTTHPEKQTWTGCGSHVPSVIDPIPPSERCDCFPFFKFEGVHYPPKKGDATRLEGSEVKAGGGLKGGSDEEGVGALGWITFAFIVSIDFYVLSWNGRKG